MQPGTTARDHHAEEHEADTTDAEEPDVPCELVLPGVDVMDPEQLMIDQTLDEVEHPPAGDHRSDEQRA